jgi:hypothetical protein
MTGTDPVAGAGQRLLVATVVTRHGHHPEHRIPAGIVHTDHRSPWIDLPSVVRGMIDQESHS